MRLTKCQRALGGVVSVLFVAGCNNDNFSNPGIITASARFRLVIEKQPNPSRLLVDSATGDLWELKTEPAGGAQWVRVATAPADARVLTSQEMIGVRSPGTPRP